MNYGVMKLADNILEIQGLSGGIGDFRLRDINLSIERGTVMGLIGKNGSGKSTLIQTISNFLPRCEGNVLFNGMPMAGNEVEVKNMLGLVLDQFLYPLASNPLKIAKLMSPVYRNFDHEKFRELMKRFDLPDMKTLIKYSTGMRNTFNIIMALCHNPDLIIMDEPTAGLDPEVRQDILDVLHEFVEDENKSILFSTHITSDLEKIADNITLIDNGKTLFTKSVIELTDEMALCRLNKDALTDELKPYIAGYRVSAFGLECLVTDKEKFRYISGVQFARPTIEDVITHKMGRSNFDELY